MVLYSFFVFAWFPSGGISVFVFVLFCFFPFHSQTLENKQTKPPPLFPYEEKKQGNWVSLPSSWTDKTLVLISTTLINSGYEEKIWSFYIKRRSTNSDAWPKVKKINQKYWICLFRTKLYFDSKNSSSY